MARFSASCPHCGKTYRVEESLLGRKARCARCRGLFRLTRTEDRTVLASSPWPWVSRGRTAPAARAASPDETPGGWRVGDVVLGLYEVRDVFTSGGMGLVYRVRHIGWNVALAVKCPRPEFFRVEQDKENFEREAETWVKLAPHPHAVACYYVRRIGGIPHVFAEYVGGGSLADWARDGRLYRGGPRASLLRILDIAIQFAWGLDHAHQEGLVHRDVKPGNLLLTESGLAKVTDFGMARAIGGTLGESASALVSAGGLTPAFCSPEQVRGEAVSRATDVWSWGVSVLEMFLGPASWTAGYLAADILEDALSRPPAPERPPMPEAVVALLRRCFRREPAERPADMGEIAHLLRAIYRNVAGTEYPRREPPAAEALPDALNNRAVSLLDLNKQEEAEHLWSKALAAGPDHPEATYNLGLVRWRDGRLSDTALVSRLREAQAAHPDRWLPTYLLASALLELGQWKEAATVLERIGGAAAQLDEVRAAFALARGRSRSADCLVRRYEGHEDWVSSVSFAPEAGRALSGSADRTMRLWDVATGRCLRVLAGHTDWVTAVALARDGRTAFSGSADGSVRVWDVETGEGRPLAEGAGRWVLALALSADDTRALTGSGDGLLALWDLGTGNRLAAVGGHDGAILSVALDPEGWLALSGGRDGTVRLWDMKEGTCRAVLTGHSDKVHAVALSADGRRALSAGADRTLRLWDIEKGACVRVLTGHDGPVLGACLSADGTCAVSAGGDRTVRVWRLGSGHCVAVLEGHSAGVSALAIDPEARLALSGSGDRTLALWLLPAPVRAPLMLARVQPAEMLLASWADFEQQLARAWQALAAGDAAEAARAVRAARALPGCAHHPEALDRWCALYARLPRTALEGGWERHLLDGHLGAVTAVAVSPDGRLALSAAADGSLRLWDVALGQPIRALESPGTITTTLAVARGGQRAVSGGADGHVRLWALDVGRLERSLGSHADVVTATEVSLDGRQLLSAGAEGSVCLWDLDTGRLLHRFACPESPLHAATLTPCGRFVVTGTGSFLIRADGQRLFTSGTLRLWDIEKGRCRHDFGGHGEAVTALALSLDGTRVLTGGGRSVTDRQTGKGAPAAGPLHLWDRTSGRCLATWDAHAGAVTAVALTGDGRFGVSTGTDRLLKVWEVETGRCLRTFAGHADAVTSLALARDARFAVTGGADRLVRVWLLDWRLEERSATDWDEAARPLVEAFRARRHGHAWSEDDFETLLDALGWAGFGWLRPEGVRTAACNK